MRRILLLVMLAAIGAVAWNYLSPLMADQTIPNYASHRVRRGDISTAKSFSAAINLLNSESHTNTTGAKSIRELYVKAGQEVRKGDKLMLLDDGTLLEAGLAGVVNEMRFDTTDWLWNNVTLVQICDLENLQVSLSVDEYDVKNVSAGQKCTVTIVPLGMDFETEITRVNRVSSSSGQVAYYTATAELAVPPQVLPGMSASVTIPAEEARDVLLLDMAALSFDEEGKPCVLKKNGEAYEQIPVETGLTDGQQVEIRSGLTEGEEVWVVSGRQTVTSSFSLAELYKRIAGEKVVINDMSGGRNNRGGMSMPADRRIPEGMRVPGGNGATDTDLRQRPEGMSFPGRNTATGTDLRQQPSGGSRREQTEQVGEKEAAP